MRRSSRPFAVLAFLLVTLAGSDARAYQWMLRHGYAGCGTCHTDPSGSGLLEPYGSMIANELLRTHYSESSDGPPNLGAFALGAFELPEALRLKGDVRLLSLSNKFEGSALEQRFILMQADFAGGVRLGNFVASASLGYAEQGALYAAITREPEDNLVSRQHWLGVWDASETILVRAGRMNLPFGVRTIEHTLWVRDLTNTSINDDQSHGVAGYYGGEQVRGELMAIAGNFQVRPDDYRERGYSGYLEVSLMPELALGASSLITHKQLDPSSAAKTWRHAHGLMGRWVTPHRPLLIATEFDYVLTSSQGTERQKGVTGYLQTDYEVHQGVHVLVTGEVRNVGVGDTPASYGAWLSYQWFFMPHADIRLDNIYYRLRSSSYSSDAIALLAQMHVYL